MNRFVVLLSAVLPFLGVGSATLGQCFFSGTDPQFTQCTFTGITAILTVTDPGGGCRSQCTAHVNAVFNAVGTGCCARLKRSCGTDQQDLVACGSNWSFKSDVSCSCSSEPWLVRIESCASGCGCLSGQIGLHRSVDCDCTGCPGGC